MKNLCLVTTPLKNTLPKKKEILFLGEWCNQLCTSNISFETCAYHWDDRKKLEIDYAYLKKLKKKILNNFAKNLNKFHKVKKSIRYWNIIIGPWINSFLAIYFERYENVRKAFADYLIKETYILKIEPDTMVPESFEHFSKLMITDTWNHYIYSEILEEINNNKFTKKYIKFKDVEKYKKYWNREQSFKKSKRQILYTFFLKLFYFYIKNEKTLIIESYLGNLNESILNLKLKTIPKLVVEKFISPNKTKLNRAELNLDFVASNNFEKILKKNISKHIPLTFLENFNYVGKKIKYLYWPQAPKIILTSHSMQRTLQSRYIAEKIENFNSKLYHGQHGGVYGQYLFSSAEDHELDICDKYLSWGWKDKNSKIIPVGVLKNLTKLNYKKNSKKFLLVLRSQSRYTHRLNSNAGSNQILKYFDNLIEFVSKLRESVRNNLIIRLHARRTGWFEDIRFKKAFNNKITIDDGTTSINKLIENSKLIIHTYLSSGYLESMQRNIPTLILCDLKVSPIRKESEYYFNQLKKAKIFHDNNESIIIFLNKNYNNIDEWWFSSKTQNAVKYFCKKYAYNNKNILFQIEKLLKT